MERDLQLAIRRPRRAVPVLLSLSCVKRKKTEKKNGCVISWWRDEREKRTGLPSKPKSLNYALL